MDKQSPAPKFGNWEIDVPYTDYFEKARKGRGAGKMITPNDPRENSEAITDNLPPVCASPVRDFTSRTSSDSETPASSKLKHARNFNGGGDYTQTVESSERHGSGAQKILSNLHQRQSDHASSGNHLRRSIEQSPLHPRATAKAGVNSPSWERKGSSEAGRASHNVAPSTPAKSRMRSVDDETQKEPHVPKFGEWNEASPGAADNYTGIFDKVRKEKLTAASKVPVMPTESSSHNSQKRDSSEGYGPVKCCCFPLSRK